MSHDAVKPAAPADEPFEADDLDGVSGGAVDSFMHFDSADTPAPAGPHEK